MSEPESGRGNVNTVYFVKVAYYSFFEAFWPIHPRTHARDIVSNAREISREV